MPQGFLEMQRCFRCGKSAPGKVTGRTQEPVPGKYGRGKIVRALFPTATSCAVRDTKKRARSSRALDASCCRRSPFAYRTYPPGLLGELGDRMREAGYFAARIVLVNDVALRRSHQLGLGARHRLGGGIAVAALDRFLDGANSAAHLGAARLVDHGATGNLARRLFGGSGIGHRLKNPLAVDSLFDRGEARRPLP